MPAVVEAPLELVETVAGMRFPAKADARLQALMDGSVSVCRLRHRTAMPQAAN